MSRRDLSELAKTLGIADAEVMTRAELRAAIERSQAVPRSAQSPWPTTWLGVARGLIASIVDKGLNLPDAAALIRGDTKLSTPPKPPPPVATVTLARIYVAQGHLQRAIDTLGEVLRSEPDHELARELRDELVARKGPGRGAPESAPVSAPVESAPVESAPVESAPAPFAAAESGAVASEAVPSVESVMHDAPSSEPPASEPPPTIEDRPSVAAVAPSPAGAAPVPAPEAAPAPELPAAVERPVRVPQRREPPRPPVAELVLIETDTAATYLYWELSATVPQPVLPEQCSLLVVAHTPAPSGAQRVERRLSVTSTSGALRLVGLPERAVLRALLTREGASHAQNGAATSKPLAVAGAVRAQEPPRDPAVRVTFSPTRSQNPADLAVRAIDRLAEASPVHW
ncbi:MAG: Rho termination factor N-terminal domain-containing protein [Polyangiaceae bacterium]